MNIIYTYGGTAFHHKTLGGLESWRKTHIPHSPLIVKTCSRPGGRSVCFCPKSILSLEVSYGILC